MCPEIFLVEDCFLLFKLYTVRYSLLKKILKLIV